MNSSAEQLNSNGFVIVDLLDETELNYLNSLAAQYLVSHAGDFVSSSHFLSVQDSKHINQELHKILKPKTDNLFPDLTLLGGTLATKIKGKSILKAHNDWSIVDETEFRSYNLWIPLVDTNKRNGTLGMIPGSHRWRTHLRGLNIPGIYERHTSAFADIGYEPSLKAGQAILYDHRLIHYSRPNKTEHPRNVAIVGMKDKDASLMVSFCLNGGNIETYMVEEEDFYGFDAAKIAKEKEKIAETPLNVKALDWQDITVLFETNVSNEFAYLIPKRKSFLTKLLDKF